MLWSEDCTLTPAIYINPTRQKIPIFLHPARAGRVLFLLILVFQLEACHVMRMPGFSFPPATHSDPKPTLKNVESHRFRVNERTAVVGQTVVMITEDGDTLPDIGRHFGLGYNDITHANPGLKLWTPATDSKVILPLQFVLPDSPRKGVILNLPNMRMFYYPEQNTENHREVITYPIGIGRQGWSTPTGKTRITQKRANPTWTVPASIRREHARDGDPLPKVVKAGPDNPLGKYALRLGIPSYLIHGTNKPFGVGMRISHGCVRLYPENIEPLFNFVSVGTRVRIINQPYLIGWLNGVLYLEANEPLEESSKNRDILRKKLLDRLKKEEKTAGVRIDYTRVERILTRANGVPTPVLTGSPDWYRISADADIVARPHRFYGEPVVPKIGPGDWTGLAGSYRDRTEARKLAEILTHQGPVIPARIEPSAEGYRVITGPFDNRKAAKKVQARVEREFGIEMAILEPAL